MADKRELVLELLARDKTAQATRSAAKNLDGVADAADDAGRRTESFGKNARTAAGHVDSLDDEIKKAQQDLVFLAQQFAETNDKAQRLDISRGMRQAENDIRRLSKSQGILKALIPGEEDTRSIGRKVVEGITAGIRSAPATGAAGGILAAAIAPSLAAGVGAAIAGGVGAGGIIGGIALVSKDPAIADYSKRIGQTFTKNVTAEAQVFKKPVIESLNVIEAAAGRSSSKIGKIFDNTAPSLRGLTQNIVRAGDAILDSFVNASGRSAPALKSLGGLVEGVGGAFADMVDELSQNSAAGASALDDLTGALVNTVRATTVTLDTLGKIKGGFDGLDKGIDGVRYKLEDNVSWLDITADGFRKGSAEAEAYRRKTLGVATAQDELLLSGKPAAEGTDRLADSMTNAERAANGERNALSLLSRELRSQIDPAFGLLNAQQNLKVAQIKAADAVSRHGRNSDQGRAATRKLAEAAVELQGKAGALSSAFDGRLTPAMRATFRAAGLTEAQIRDVEREFVRAKGAGDRFAKRYTANVTANTAGAIRALEGFRKKINTIDGRVITVKTRITSAGEYIPGQGTVPREYGGPVRKGHAYVVGEKRPEVFVPDRDGRIVPSIEQFSAATARGAMAAGGSAAGPTEVVLRMVWDTAPGADRALHEVMRRAIRIYGPL